jgi:EAL domain-containing protein (putative c-di-GMP-specific phosphodiesterase class I)
VSQSALLAALREAIAAREIGLMYQPKLELATGRLIGVEALARWDHPALGVQSAAEFIPLAEKEGLIGALTDAAIRTALVQWRAWRADVPCEYLTIELTEGATQHVMNLMDTLTRLRIKGIRAAIDDFGTGYSSLLQLRQLPFTELKIDKWFVNDAMRAGESALIIRSVIDLAHALGLIVTAEGIETQEQYDLLAGYGCNQGQGALFAMPMPGPDLAPWAREHEAHWQERRARSVLEA